MAPDELAELLLQVSALVVEHRQTALAGLGLTPSLARALRALEAGESVPMGELACRLGCDASNVTSIVTRLEARGFVRREVARHDRRVKTLVITAEGITVRHRMADALACVPDPLARLPQPRRAALTRALREVLQ